VSTWERLAERGPIEVRYLRSRPSSNRLSLSADPTGLIIFLIFGSVLAGVGGFLVVRASRNVLKTHRLLRVGQAAPATVVAIEETNVTINRRPRFRLRYSYRDLHGRSHEGESGYLSWEEVSRWKEGDTGAVRFDPERPAASHWVGNEELPAAGIVDAPPPASRN